MATGYSCTWLLFPPYIARGVWTAPSSVSVVKKERQKGRRGQAPPADFYTRVQIHPSLRAYASERTLTHARTPPYLPLPRSLSVSLSSSLTLALFLFFELDLFPSASATSPFFLRNFFFFSCGVGKTARLLHQRASKEDLQAVIQQLAKKTVPPGTVPSAAAQALASHQSSRSDSFQHLHSRGSSNSSTASTRRTSHPTERGGVYPEDQNKSM